jgi:hypothetical protein
MLEKTRRFASDSDVDTFNYETDGPRFARYPYRRAGVANVPDESVPLFLSDEDEDQSEPQPYEFVRERPRRKKTFAVGRVLVGAVAVIAAAGAAALFSSDATRAIIVNAKASLAATLNQPRGAAPQAAALKTRLANSVEVATLGVQPTAIAPSQPQATATGGQVPAAVAAGPSRADISAAMKSARQIQADIRQPTPAPVVVAPAVVAAPPAPAPHIEKIDPDTLAGMMSRAKSLMAIGDITSARLLLQRAAEAQNADAAFMLGQTYDPAVLGSQDIRSITPDPAIARNWYQKAAQLGSADAQQRLAQMQN